ncbi:MAG: YARHG domain-containing protein [Clostridia bacterium]|nr:YARHG domain-containing protein [Clostridia bacterium]
MKRLKKFMSVVLALCCAITMTLSVSMNVSAVSDEDFYTEIKDTGNNINTSKLYYDKNTGKFYIKAIKYQHTSYVGYIYSIWLYEINDKGVANETNRLTYGTYQGKSEHVDGQDTFNYYINFNDCSIDEFYKQYKSFDDKYTEIDAEQGMSELNNFSSDFSTITTVSTDYSYVSNITLDIGGSQKLLPKVILNEKDNLKITWSSSDDNVATVDNDGNVTAKNSGSCTVSAKLEGLDESIAEYTIRVRTNDEILKTAAMQFAKEKYKEYALADIDDDGEKELVLKGQVADSSDDELIVYEYQNGNFNKSDNYVIMTDFTTFYSKIKIYKNKLYVAIRGGDSQYDDGKYYDYIYEYKENKFTETKKLNWSGILNGIQPFSAEETQKILDINSSSNRTVSEVLASNSWKINDKDVTPDELEKEVKKYENYPDLIFTPYNTQPSDYIFFDSDVRYLTDNEVKKLDSTDIKYAINEIYARHGYIFKDEELRNYFHEKSWYSGSVEDVNSIQFNSYEDENLKLLAKYR